MKELRLAILLTLLVGVGAGCFLLMPNRSAAAAGKAVVGQDPDAKHPRRKEYNNKFQSKWDFLDWCFAQQDDELTRGQDRTMGAIKQYINAVRVGEDLGSCTSFDRALVGIDFIDISSGELTDISPVGGLKKVKRLAADSNGFEEIEAVVNMPSLEYIQVYKNHDVATGARNSVKCPDFGKRKVTCCVDGWKKQDCTWPKK